MVAVASDWYLEIVIDEPQKRLPCASQFEELGEDRRDGILDSAIGLLSPRHAAIDLDEADRNGNEQFATCSLLLARVIGADTQQVQLVFAQGPIYAE